MVLWIHKIIRSVRIFKKTFLLLLIVRFNWNGVASENTFERNLTLSDSCLEDITHTCSQGEESSLTSLLDFDIQPCDNFYKFACGKWKREHPRPPYIYQWDNFFALGEKFREKVKEILTSPKDQTETRALGEAGDIFKHCLDASKEGLKPLENILLNYGDWPLLLAGTWEESQFNWVNLVADSQRMLEVPLFIEVKVNIALGNNSFNQIYISQPELYPIRAALLSDTELSPKLIASYINLITQIAKILSTYKGLEVDATYLEVKVQEIIDFEVQFSKLMKTKGFNSGKGGYFKLQNLQNFTDAGNTSIKISWKDMLNRVFFDISEVTIDDDEEIGVLNTEYIDQLFELLNETPVETLANYMILKLILPFISFTTDEMREVFFEFKTAYFGATEPPSREYSCSMEVNKLFDVAISHEYLMTWFSREAKLEVEEMTEILKSSVINIIKQPNGLSPDIKLRAIQTVAGIKKCIGYPNWLINPADVDNYYDFQEDMKTDNFLSKIIELNVWKKVKVLKSLREASNTNCNWLFLDLLNSFLPYYERVRNTLNIPMGFLQYPEYQHNLSVAIKYGRMGVVLGHEIAHSLPKQGWTEDKDGIYSTVSTCLIDAYENFATSTILPGLNVNALNGNLTLYENFPDNFGLQAAFWAFTQKSNTQASTPSSSNKDQTYNSEQRFFLAFAQTFCDGSTKEISQIQLLSDTHSPPEFRVLGSLRNFDEFSRVWSCPLGSYMNPLSKCKLA